MSSEPASRTVPAIAAAMPSGASPARFSPWRQALCAWRARDRRAGELNLLLFALVLARRGAQQRGLPGRPHAGSGWSAMRAR
ncbi:hypothetical protein ACU4HD_13785 [Cupriavidus basilensis]